MPVVLEDDGASLGDIAHEMHLGEERIRQLQREAIGSIRVKIGWLNTMRQHVFAECAARGLCRSVAVTAIRESIVDVMGADAVPYVMSLSGLEVPNELPPCESIDL